MSTHAKDAVSATPTERYATSSIPTPRGDFELIVYRTGSEEAVAMLRRPLPERALVRVHSECVTGEVFGSLRCDCKAQLELALDRIAAEGGALIYLKQEGRGIGLGNKIRAYALQDSGRDTVDANLELGFEDDERSYGVAARILADLGISAVRLMTNNPRKVEQLISAGLDVTAEPHWAESGEHSKSYLETKRARLGHTGSPRGSKGQ